MNILQRALSHPITSSDILFLLIGMMYSSYWGWGGSLFIIVLYWNLCLFKAYISK